MMTANDGERRDLERGSGTAHGGRPQQGGTKSGPTPHTPPGLYNVGAENVKFTQWVPATRALTTT